MKPWNKSTPDLLRESPPILVMFQSANECLYFLSVKCGLDIRKYLRHRRKIITDINLEMECKPLSKHFSKEPEITNQNRTECFRLGCSHAGSRRITLFICILWLTFMSSNIYLHFKYSQVSLELSQQLDRVDQLTLETRNYHKAQQWFGYLSKQVRNKI